MSEFLSFTIVGIVTGSVYAVAASGLVLTYVTSGIFNIAHGAIGMLMAFTYWELRVHQGWPAPLALVVVVFVIAPLLGAGIERTLIRGLRGASVATSLVVTVGLMVGLMGLAQLIWDPRDARQLSGFFAPGGFRVSGVFVRWHEVLTILAAAGVALGLWLLLARSRIGVAMRAVVDDRNLAALNGARPARVMQVSWALGASTAALAGILLAPVLQMNVLVLTLLVVNAYAAAMVGRLRSLPLTFAGALALGLIESYAVGYVNLTGPLAGLRPSLPTVFLFVVLFAMPESRLRAARLVGAITPRAPDPSRSLKGAVALVATATVLATVLGEGDLVRAGQGLALGIIMLSLVVLTGYGGQVSLCQMTFAGLGAFAMARVGVGGNPGGLIAAVALAGAVGALVALPALKLQGLYLALSTMAFAVLMDNMLFPDRHVFGTLGSLTVDRPPLFESERAFFVFLAIAFAGVALLVQWVRRGAFGRVLTAMRDSQVACATLGLSLARTKLAVFVISAGIAGLGGALFGALKGSAGPTDFLMIQSLPILLLAVIGGITTAGGALAGGIAFAVLPIIEEKVGVSGIVQLTAGGAGVLLGRNPNGLANLLRFPRPTRADATAGTAPPSASEPAAEVTQVVASAG